LLPVARLAEAHGHRVRFAGQAAVVPRLAAMGFETFVVGPDTLSAERLPLVAVDRQAERGVVRDHFVGRYGAQRAEALGALFGRERPSVVVCDEVDVGAVLAAEIHGIPCVTVTVLAAGRMAPGAVAVDVWNDVRARHRLAPDPDGARLGGVLALAPSPRSFRDPSVPWPPVLQAVRPPILDQTTRSPAPFVYATLGTVFNVESGDLLHRVARALSTLPVEALLTVGPTIDPGELGDVGANVRIEQFVPQHEVLGRCAALVCHGGSGTLVAALSLGVPVVVLPMGADQPDNADRCEALGVGLAVDPMVADAATIADAASMVLSDDRYALAAGRLAVEAAAQTRLQDVTELLALLDAH